MIIVMCCTRNWYIHLATELYALFKYNKVKKVYLFIEDNEISYLNDKRIKFININTLPEYITQDSPNYNTQYTKLSYLRCYFSKVLNEDKILYIDADAIVIDNIEDLWNIDLQDNVLAGVHEYGDWNRHLNTYGLNDTYINSGVLLMNLKTIREERLDDSMIYLLNHNKYAFPDQDVINLVCRNRIKHISNIYNSAETTGIVDNAKIIHYIRGNKGWLRTSKRSEIWYNFHKEMIGGDKMENYRVKATRNFDDIEKGVHREKGKSEWLCSGERYLFLKENNAVELIEIIPKVEAKIEYHEEEKKPEVSMKLELEDVKVIAEQVNKAVKKSKKSKK